MSVDHGVRRVQSDLEPVLDDLHARGCRIYELSVTSGTRTGFFDEVRRVLPLDPPISASGCWDAFSDSLWSGLDGQDARRVAIVIRAWARLEAESPETASMIAEVFDEVAALLGDEDATDGNPTELTVLLSVG